MKRKAMRGKLCAMTMAGVVSLIAFGEDVTLSVASGEMTFAGAMTDNGYASYPQDARLVKTGAGLLKAATDTATRAATRGIWVREGVLQVTSQDEFGSTSLRGVDDLFKVDDGGTMYFTGSACVMIGQVVHISGKGAAKIGNTDMPENGAIAIANNVYAFGVKYVLDQDATMMNVYGSRHAQMFGKWTAAAWLDPTCIDLSGHVLTMSHTSTAKNNGHGFLLTTHLKIAGSGQIVMDHAPLIQNNAAFTATRDAGTTVELVLTNSASFQITAPDTVNLFDNIRVFPGSEIKGIASGEIALDVAGISGAGVIGDGISILEIKDRFGVAVSDIASGAMLEANGEVGFSTGAKIVIEGDVAALVASGPAEYPVLHAAGGVFGMPIVDGAAHRRFKVLKSADGKTLKLAYVDPKPAGAVDAVGDWGIVEGASASASDNSAVFASHIASAPAGTTVYFPAGDYYFSEPLSVNGRSGIAFVGDGGASVIHGPGAGSVITVVNSSDITVARIALDNCTGPAVAANGADRLVVSNLLYSAVGGVVDGEDGRYPVSIADSSDTYVRHNRVTDGATYDAAVYRDGGTAATGSEPIPRDVNIGYLDIWVDEGEVEGFYEAFAKTGYAFWPAATRLVKSGPGTLVGTNNLTSVMTGVTVQEGVMRFKSLNDIGVNGYGIEVNDGATAVFLPGMYMANRSLQISGDGAPGMGGAIVEVNDGAGNKFGAGNITVRLVGDATIVGGRRGVCSELISGGGSENSSKLYLGGHTLTLRAQDGCLGISTHYKLRMCESGTIVVDGTSLSDRGTSDGSSHVYAVDDGVFVTVKLINGASFEPKFSDWASMFGGIEADEGTTISCGLASGSLPLAFADFSGLPTIAANISSLAITNRLVVNASDLMAGKHLAVDCPMSIAATAKVVLKDPLNVFASVPANFCYAFAESTSSLTGSPSKDRVISDTTRWSIDCPAGGMVMNIVPPLGIMLIVQ